MVAARRGTATRRRVNTGVSISSSELCAADVRLGSSDAWRRALDPPPLDGGPWPSLSAALHDLARTVGTESGSLSISLLSPLIEVRRVDLPPARAEDLQILLTRNAGRYFVNARGPQVVGVSTLARGGRGESAIVVAAAASARLVASIRAAAEDAGWLVDTIAPAETAWAAAALAAWPAFERGTAFVAIAHGDRTDLLQLEQRRLAGVRRFRAATDDASLVADAIGAGARIGIFGAAQQRGALSTVLSSAGARVNVNSAGSDNAGMIAAEYAGASIGPALKSEAAISRERDTVRRARWIVAGAAAALFAIAAGIQLWGVHHQLELVRRDRDELRPKIASTLVGRTTIEAAFNDLAALASADRDATQWSSVIAALTDGLPDDAHLTAIRARGDSIVVEGLADHAAPVFDSLSRIPLLRDVKAAAPVRRELQDGGASLEHFVIAARVRTTEGAR